MASPIKKLSLREQLTPPLWIFTLVGIVFLAWILLELKEIVSLLVISYAIAYIIHPVLSRLERWKISRPIGVFVLTGTALIVLILLALTAFPTIDREYATLMENLPSYIAKARERATILAERYHIPLQPGKLDKIFETLPRPSGEAVKGTALAVGKALLSGYSITLTLINLALLPFLVFYLASDFPHMHVRALEFFGGATRRKIAEIGGEIDGYVSGFVRGQIIVGCILVVLYAIGLGGFVGIDLWFLIAVITGLGNMVPYLGSIVGFTLSSIMALVTFGDLSHLLYTWCVFGVVQTLEGTIITPRVVGETVGISPLVVILALFAGGQLFGLLGLFLAIPVTAALRVLLRHAHSAIVYG